MPSTDAIRSHPADFVLDCNELTAALDYYTRQLGFRLEVIFPADNPRTAVLTGFGKCLHLQRTGNIAPATAAYVPSVAVHHASDDSWGAGR